MRKYVGISLLIAVFGFMLFLMTRPVSETVRQETMRALYVRHIAVRDGKVVKLANGQFAFISNK